MSREHASNRDHTLGCSDKRRMRFWSLDIFSCLLVSCFERRDRQATRLMKRMYRYSGAIGTRAQFELRHTDNDPWTPRKRSVPCRPRWVLVCDTACRLVSPIPEVHSVYTLPAPAFHASSQMRPLSPRNTFAVYCIFPSFLNSPPHPTPPSPTPPPTP